MTRSRRAAKINRTAANCLRGKCGSADPHSRARPGLSLNSAPADARLPLFAPNSRNVQGRCGSKRWTLRLTDAEPPLGPRIRDAPRPLRSHDSPRHVRRHGPPPHRRSHHLLARRDTRRLVGTATPSTSGSRVCRPSTPRGRRPRDTSGIPPDLTRWRYDPATRQPQDTGHNGAGHRRPTRESGTLSGLTGVPGVPGVPGVSGVPGVPGVPGMLNSFGEWTSRAGESAGDSRMRRGDVPWTQAGRRPTTG
ncbi:hypothetical protein DWB77_00221 [Streptomyces hundungensis]|uniref:Uncharacterized protein n=1 Tax=Streptomyces hundungensis TaxID=1077946 RepID=A0A387H445_9ACTN|nr:hypothetical protein DWB77_00221 [Streptomyces hundungensis]